MKQQKCVSWLQDFKIFAPILFFERGPNQHHGLTFLQNIPHIEKENKQIFQEMTPVFFNEGTEV